MNYDLISIGMTGKDFMKVINKNFNLTDVQLLELIGQMIYKVNSSDIKEFKVEDGTVYYTLDSEETDPRIWHTVDITAWGNITGDITNQEDLKNALDSKAALITFNTLSELVSTINTRLGTAEGTIVSHTTELGEDATAIANINAELDECVKSTTIQQIRLNGEVFQWSPDGINWYAQPIVTSIAWGNLTGNIENQTDLIGKFNTVNESIDTLSSLIESLQTNITTLSTAVSAAESAVSEMQTELSTLSTDYEEFKTLTNTTLTLLQENADDYIVHKGDKSNPHEVNAEQVGLGNVENLAPADLPISTATQTYVDTADNNLETNLKTFMNGKYIENKNGVKGIYVGTGSDYVLDKATSDLAYNNTLCIVSSRYEETKPCIVNLIPAYSDIMIYDMSNYMSNYINKVPYNIGNNIAYNFIQGKSYYYSASANGYENVDFAELVIGEADTYTIELTQSTTSSILTVNVNVENPEIVITDTSDSTEIEPEKNGQYVLALGSSYTWSASKTGYTTQTGTISSVAQQELTLNITLVEEEEV